MNQKFKIVIQEQTESTVRFQLIKNEQYLSFKEVFTLWNSNSEFVQFYTKSLVDINFKAFYWEHPALNNKYLQKQYECIL